MWYALDARHRGMCVRPYVLREIRKKKCNFWANKSKLDFDRGQEINRGYSNVWIEYDFYFIE